MLLCLYIDSFFKKLKFITMFLLTVLVLGAKNLQKLQNRYRHLRLSFATYNSDWSKVSDVSEPLRNTWFVCCPQNNFYLLLFCSPQVLQWSFIYANGIFHRGITKPFNFRIASRSLTTYLTKICKICKLFNPTLPLLF